MGQVTTSELFGAPLVRISKHLPIREFIETNVILSSRSAAKPGPISLDWTPYVVPVLEAAVDPDVRKITLVWCSQSGKSTTLSGLALYFVCTHGWPFMWVFPETKSRNMFISDRLRPLIELSDRFMEELRPGKRSITNQRIDFESAPLYTALASSESDLASRSVGGLLLDEIDKYPSKTTKEGSPIDQAEARLRTFPRSKMFQSSTPTNPDGAVWRAWKDSDQREWHIECPKCKTPHTWNREDIGISDRPEGLSLKEFINDLKNGKFSAWWECPSCKHQVKSEATRRKMNRGGYFVTNSPGGNHAGFRVTALATPNTSFRDYAVKYLEAIRAKEEDGDDDKMMMFTIHQDAMPYERDQIKLSQNEVGLRATKLAQGIVPYWYSRLVLGCDVQQDGIYWVVMAIGKVSDHYKLHCVDWGFIDQPMQDTTAMLDRLVVRKFVVDSKKDQQVHINCVFIDSGDGNLTADVYSWCNGFRIDQPIFPIKGQQKQQGWLRKSKGAEHRDKLTNVNTTMIKDAWFSHLSRETDHPAAVSFAEDAEFDEDFQRQLVSEIKEGKVYVPRKGYGKNHYLDCVVYAMAAGARVGAFGSGKKQQRPVPRRRGQVRL